MTNHKGFTLIELMIGVAILAIVIVLAIPSFNSMLFNNRVETAADELYGALQLARSEAVKRQQGVLVCRADSDWSECIAGSDWSGGWLMTVDDEVLRMWEGSGGLNVTGPAAGITFYGSGMADAAQTFEVTGSGCVGDRKREVKISRVGAMTLRAIAC